MPDPNRRYPLARYIRGDLTPWPPDVRTCGDPFCRICKAMKAYARDPERLRRRERKGGGRHAL